MKSEIFSANSKKSNKDYCQRVETRRPVQTKKPAHPPENLSGRLEMKQPTRRNARAGSNKETGPPPGESLQTAGKKQESEIKNTTLYYTTPFFFLDNGGGGWDSDRRACDKF